VVSAFADGFPPAGLVALVALFGHLSVLFRLRSPFLGDESLDQGEEAVVEIRIRNRFSSHDSEHSGGTRRHRDRGRSDARAGGLSHFLQRALLSLGRNEDDARSVAIIGTGGLQVQRDVQLVFWLVIPRPGQDTGLAGPLQHVSLAEQRALYAPTDRIAFAGNRLAKRSRPGEGSTRIMLGGATRDDRGHRKHGHEA